MKQLEKSQVHLWFAGLEKFDLCLVYKKYADWLSSEEIDRVSLYQSRRQREHFVLGRIILKLILSKYINCEPSTFKFHSDKRGKLFLSPSNKPSLFFNVSHSHDRLVIAVSRIRELGVDVEFAEESRAILKIAKRYFSQQEFQDLCNLPKSLQVRRFYELWTLKESVLKAYGVGLAGHLSQIKFAFPASGQIDMRFDLATHCSAEWQSWQIETSGPYALALAIRSLDTRITQIESHILISLDEVVLEETQIIRSF